MGEVYANLFPEQVRAMTLDGRGRPGGAVAGGPLDRVDHRVSYRVGHFIGTERALSTFLAACAADARCAFREPGVDLRAKYNKLLARVRRGRSTS